MPVIIKDPARRWNQRIPYEIDAAYPNRQSLEQNIDKFNQHFSQPIFVAHRNEPRWVVFKHGSESPIGQASAHAGPQDLKCNSSNMFHEMGHCCGLGHSFYHTLCENFTNLFEGLDRANFMDGRGDYVSVGNAYVDSMMCYHPNSFKSSPRINWVMRHCENHNRDYLRTIEGNLKKLLTLSGQAKGAPPDRMFSIWTEVPSMFKTQGSSDRPRPQVRRAASGGAMIRPSASAASGIQDLRLQDNNDLRNEGITEVIRKRIRDVEIIRAYWRFYENHMMRITPHDVMAIKKALALN